MPPGFPRGQRRFTTAKVIVARVFAPKDAPERRPRELAFDPDDSSHGTHVAGIAAGNAQTPAAGGRVVSGVAPRAYIGNYKVFVETDSGLTPNANSPAIVAAIEAAVADGMDVINFSGGEPEIEPSRDIVALALDAAAAAGVVPVVAAGNDFNDVGAGSVSSPANSARALAVGAVEISGNPATRVHAAFSSVGPTTMSLQLKPDVAAPGVDVLSSVPGGWGSFSGTSMAAPHVAGAAALLAPTPPGVDRRPAQVRARPDGERRDQRERRPRRAAVPGRRCHRAGQGRPTAPLRRADGPFVRVARTAKQPDRSHPPRRRRQRSRDVAGRGRARVFVERRRNARPPRIGRGPGNALVRGGRPRERETRRSHRLHRAPPWRRSSASSVLGARVGRRSPASHRHSRSRSQASTEARLRDSPALVSRYRYPESPRGIGVTTVLRGPERVYRIRLTKRVANFGVVVTQRGRGSRVEPRVVAQLDENRLTGYAGLPVSAQPVPRGVPLFGASGRRAQPRAGGLRGRLRQRRPRRSWVVHVPVLGERRDAPRRSGCARGR